MGLAEIAARAEGEYANISGELGPDSPMEGSEIPSVFGEPDGTALQEPPSGYFIPSHHSKERDAGDYKPYARSGGMHLRNLLDDAPDAEGGAHAQATGGIRMPQDDDSATEDEAEPARYAQESVDARGALRQAHADRAASQQRYVSRNVKEEMLEVDAARHRNHPVEHAHYPSHLRSSSYGSRSEHVEAGHFSPTYLGLAPERGYSMPPRQVYSRTGHAHYDAAVPASGHWAPYEGRSIYGPPTGSGYFHRSRHEEQASHAHHGQEYHHPAFLDSAVHDKAPHRTTFQPHPHLTSSLLAGGAHSPPPQGSHPLRRISDPHAPSIDQAYYERYGPHRPRQ